MSKTPKIPSSKALLDFFAGKGTKRTRNPIAKYLSAHRGEDRVPSILEVFGITKRSEADIILQDIVNSYEDEGCENYGTVSSELIERARKYLSNS